MRPRKPSSTELKLIRENSALKTEIIRLRRQVEDKQGAVGRLHILMHERTERIDELNAKLAQLRDQNKRLDQEAERLAAMVQLTPGDPL